MALATATIIGLTTSAIGAGMSFKQAAEAKTAAQTAETDAKNLMDEAKKNIEKDYMEELTVPLDAFEAASKENIALQNQSIQAIREGDQRGSYGAVTQLGQDAAEQRRISMGQELSDLQKLKIQSKENIRDEIVSMDVAGAADANLRARDAQESRTAALTNAVNALGQGASAYAEGQALYKKTNKTNTTDKSLSAGGVGGYGTVLAPPQGGYDPYGYGGPPPKRGLGPTLPQSNPYDAWDIMNYNAWEAKNR
jgi:hypothetical protein